MADAGVEKVDLITIGCMSPGLFVGQEHLASLLADELGVTTAQLAIAWLLRRKEVSSVITGATKLSQLKDNLASREIVSKLDDDLLERIETILDNNPLNSD